MVEGGGGGGGSLFQTSTESVVFIVLYDLYLFHSLEAEFLDKTQPKVSRVFLLIIHSSLLQVCLRFLFLQTHATSYSFCKGERRKTDKKTIPLSCGFINPCRIQSLITEVVRSLIRLQQKLLQSKLLLRIFFFSFVQYSALLHLPPLRFHCTDGCRTVATGALAVRRSNH